MGVKRADLVEPIDLHPMREKPPPAVLRGRDAWRALRAATGGPTV